MKILSTNVYVGPNIYAGFPVIRHVIDLGILEEYPTNKLGKDFVDKLIEAVPTLQEHHCSEGAEGGFISRLRDGTWLGHVWEHVTLEIQTLAGTHVSFGRTRETGKKPGEYNLVFEYKQRDVGLKACELALDLLVSILPEEVRSKVEHQVPGDFDFAYEKVRFIRFAQKMNFGPSTQSLLDAAIERNIPYLRLNEASLVQLGYGKYQKRIQATITSETKFISVELASNKSAAAELLDSLGLPVPRQEIVGSEREAVRAADKIGYPVVVKPLDGNHGRGISINLNTPEQVAEGFHVAKEVSRSVIVESFLEGEDHRMLVVNGKLVAVAKRVPGHIVGDGKHTVAELVEVVNQDPRRGVGHEKVLTRLELDYQAQQILEKKGYTSETVLANGEVCYLRDTANLSTGGTAIDLTDQVHPDNKEMAERAIKAVGLDVGGVDFLTKDISRSYLDIGGGICEVNAAPGFRMHTHPTEGTPRDVAGAVMDMLFPDSKKARIPTVAITGTNGKTTTSRMIAHLWKQAGKVVGLTTTDGIYINGKLVVKGDTTGPVSAQMVLQDPNTEIAVLETARGGLLRSGLGYEFCDVGACLNVSADHIDITEGNGLADLAKVKRIVTDAARDTAVLNADDIECLKMAASTEAKNIFYVTMNPQHSLVREHIRLGGKAVIIEKGLNGDMLTIFDNQVHIPVLWSHLIPATIEGKAVHNVQNAMFAVAMSYAMGMSLDDIRNGLRTFVNSYHQTPGRMNFYDEHPFKVLLDYGHNPAAISMVCKFVEQTNVPGRKTAIFALPGDRTNELIEESVKLLPAHFSHFILKQDDNKRGRKDGEIPELIRSLLIKHGAKADNIQIVLDEEKAVETGLSTAKEGDFLVVFADKVSRGWKQITSFKSDSNARVKDSDTRSESHLLDRTEVDEISKVISSAGISSDSRGVIMNIEEELND
ncbi:MAG: cyanophycin synthetase [Neisseriaceae bacterium]|jgi:cyanophycin synthetase|nr:MAG: cyanophycin synthetase [Neisseriaceae bacterium]